MIQSSSSKQIKYLSSLQNKSKVRNEMKQFVVEGERITKEIPEDMLVSMYVSESYEKQSLNIPFKGYEVVADNVFKGISKTVTPQGILAIAKQPQYSLEDMLSEGKKTLIFLEDIRDPGNLGTIIRAAEGADVDGIVMSKGTVDVFNPKVTRSTMGAIYRMPFVYVDDMQETVKYAKDKGIVFFAAHLKGKSDYATIKYPKRSAVIIGNEANGISETIANEANELVKIPMTGKVESLNASIAASVFMYEIYRQRRLY